MGQDRKQGLAQRIPGFIPGGNYPVIRCREENGWIATGCSADSYETTADNDEYMGIRNEGGVPFESNNGCTGDQIGTNGIWARCCRIR